MAAKTATAEIRRDGKGYVAVTQVGAARDEYPLPADRADLDAYAAHFRAAAERQGYEVAVRIDE